MEDKESTNENTPATDLALATEGKNSSAAADVGASITPAAADTTEAADSPTQDTSASVALATEPPTVATPIRTTCQAAAVVVPESTTKEGVTSQEEKEGDSACNLSTLQSSNGRDLKETVTGEPVQGSKDNVSETDGVSAPPTRAEDQRKEDSAVELGATEAGADSVPVKMEENTEDSSEQGKVPGGDALPSKKDAEGPSYGQVSSQTSSKEGNDETSTIRSPEEIERAFASGAQERLLGLLGAILPQDSKVFMFHFLFLISLSRLSRLTNSFSQTVLFTFLSPNARSLAAFLLY